MNDDRYEKIKGEKSTNLDRSDVVLVIADYVIDDLYDGIFCAISPVEQSLVQELKQRFPQSFKRVQAMVGYLLKIGDRQLPDY